MNCISYSPRFRAAALVADLTSAQSMQQFMDACKTLESHTPQYFQDVSFSNGVSGYYGRLDKLVSGEPQTSGLLPVLSLNTGLERIQVMSDVATRFKLLKLDHLVSDLHATLPEERPAYLRKMLFHTRTHVKSVADDLYHPVAKAAKYFGEPEARAQKSDVQGYLRETARLKQRTPEWYRLRGLAESIVTYTRQLEQCFKTFLQSSDDAAASPKYAPASPGSLLLMPISQPVQPTMRAPLPVETLMAVRQEFETLKTGEKLDAMLTRKTFQKQLGAVFPRVLKAPARMQKLAEKLYAQVKTLAPAIAQIQLSQTTH